MGRRHDRQGEAEVHGADRQPRQVQAAPGRHRRASRSCPKARRIASIGDPPSVPNLAKALGAEGQRCRCRRRRCRPSSRPCRRVRPPPPRRPRRNHRNHDARGDDADLRSRESGRPRRRRRDAAAAADLHDAQAAAADREPAAPRTPARVARRARRRRGRAVDGLSARRVPPALRVTTAPGTTASATSCCATRSRTSRSAPRARSASRPRASTSGSSCATATCSPSLDLDAMVRFHDEQRRGGDDLAHRRSTTRVRSASCRPRPTAASSRSSRSRRPARRRATGSTRARTSSSRRSCAGSRPASTCRSSGRRSRGCSPSPGSLFGFQSDAYWLDIGTPEKYLQAHADALAGRLSDPPAPGARETSRRASGCRATATIEPGAQIEAPVLIGDGARIEAGRAGARVGARRGRGRRGRAPSSTARCCTTGARVSHGGSVRDSVVGAIRGAEARRLARRRRRSSARARPSRRGRGSRAGGCRPSASR